MSTVAVSASFTGRNEDARVRSSDLSVHALRTAQRPAGLGRFVELGWPPAACSPPAATLGLLLPRRDFALDEVGEGGPVRGRPDGGDTATVGVRQQPAADAAAVSERVRVLGTALRAAHPALSHDLPQSADAKSIGSCPRYLTPWATKILGGASGAARFGEGR